MIIPRRGVIAHPRACAPAHYARTWRPSRRARVPWRGRWTWREVVPAAETQDKTWRRSIGGRGALVKSPGAMGGNGVLMEGGRGEGRTRRRLGRHSRRERRWSGRGCLRWDSDAWLHGCGAI